MNKQRVYHNGEWVYLEDPASNIIRYDELQPLTPTERATARNNIEAHEEGSPAPAVYTTEIPTSANAEGLKIYCGTVDPETKYDGWLYLIKASQE